MKLSEENQNTITGIVRDVMEIHGDEQWNEATKESIQNDLLVRLNHEIHDHSGIITIDVTPFLAPDIEPHGKFVFGLNMENKTWSQRLRDRLKNQNPKLN